MVAEAAPAVHHANAWSSTNPEGFLPGETKTARKKRLRARRDNAGPVIASPAALASNRASTGRAINDARRTTCSDYWAREKLARRPTAPPVACGCVRCNGRRLWPANHYVATLAITIQQAKGYTETWQVPISYECLQEQRRDSPDEGLNEILAQLRGDPDRYGAIIFDRNREFI